MTAARHSCTQRESRTSFSPNFSPGAPCGAGSEGFHRAGRGAGCGAGWGGCVRWAVQAMLLGGCVAWGGFQSRCGLRRGFERLTIRGAAFVIRGSRAAGAGFAEFHQLAIRGAVRAVHRAVRDTGCGVEAGGFHCTWARYTGCGVGLGLQLAMRRVQRAVRAGVFGFPGDLVALWCLIPCVRPLIVAGLRVPYRV